MLLSNRLQAIARMVTPGNRLVDVGCDHGYLPVYLIREGVIPSALAMDVGKGPLARAMEHIRESGLEERIETRLSDGLAALREGEGDTLVIAGMGGPLMERILEAYPAKRDSFRELILQPQSHIPHFRRYLNTAGYRIVQEEMILEDGKYYPMMKAQRGEEERRPEVPITCSWEVYTQEELFGGFLLAEKHPVLRRFLIKEKKNREQILKALMESKDGTEGERYHEIVIQKERIDLALADMEGGQ